MTGQVIVLERAQWCTRAPRSNYGVRPLSDVKGVMFHHTTGRTASHGSGFAALTQWANLIVAYSIDTRGYADCEYHAMIGSPVDNPNLGVIYGARNVAWVGAHSNNRLPGEAQTANYTRFGCALLGDFRYDTLTVGHKAAMNLYAYLAALTIHRAAAINWHQQVQGFPTACPGQHVIDQCHAMGG